MPTLYHYTCRHNLENIEREKKIRRGIFVNQAGEIEEGKAVNLTTDSDSTGHGLPDGREFEGNQIKNFRAYAVKDDRKISVDHTAYRLAVDIDCRNTKLSKVSDLLGIESDLFLNLEASAYHPLDKHLDLFILNSTRQQIKQRKILGKGNTWWYYFAEISIDQLTECAAKLPDGTYHPESPDAFWELLREDMQRRAGI